MNRLGIGGFKNGVFWTDERVEELRTLAKTMSASAIAAHFGVTRNTICGKLHRERIRRTHESSVPRPKVRRIVAPLKPKDRPTFVNGMMARVRAGAPLRGQAPQPYTEPAQPVPATAVDILGLSGKTCRWPLWRDGEPKLYCGGEVHTSPYCRFHRRMSYTPPRAPAEGEARRDGLRNLKISKNHSQPTNGPIFGTKTEMEQAGGHRQD